MCGFAGILHSDPQQKADPAMLRRMTETIAHRGPDADGYQFEDSLGMGFRRLSIIDLEGGQQPMTDAGDRAWITFNGEIYNYREVREKLKQKGYRFTTNSDTEVVLNAYLEFGISFVEHLRGMFAFAIYDRRSRKLVLGRDRFGIKPLFYSLSDNFLVFGSELKVLLASGSIQKEIDPRAVDSYFSYGYIISPLTIYKSARKLPAASLMVVDQKGTGGFNVEISKYWAPVFRPDATISFVDYKQRLKEKLSETVQAHLVSDVPVGAFLSGGIDSNAVVSTMVRLVPGQVKTFSIGFKDKNFNEAALAASAAKAYGTRHTELYLEPGSADVLDKIVDVYDEPFGDSSAIPTYFVSKMAAESVKVVLSGDGGDELFGGYNDYQRLQKIRRFRYALRLASPALRALSSVMPYAMKGRRFLYSLSRNPDYLHALAMEVNDQEKKFFFSREYYESHLAHPASELKTTYLVNSVSSEYLSRQMELDIQTYMTDDILTKVDRASMAHSLEARVPLIDHEFFELASAIPVSMKVSGATGKYIFREAVKDMIPDYIYSKPKTGFTVPITKWFKDDLSDYVVSALEAAGKTGVINPAYIKDLLNTGNPGSLVTRIWPVIVFSAWYRKHQGG